MSQLPIRYRIISGISDTVLVVEALARSGSTITARYAKNDKKPVYAIPNSIYSTTSSGTNRLIQDGAILVTKPSQIIENLKTILPTRKASISMASQIVNSENLSNVSSLDSTLNSAKKTPNEPILHKIPECEKVEFPVEYLPIYRILSDEPCHINEIAKKLDLTVQEISSLLTLMEIDGYAYQPRTNYFTKK